MLVLSYCTWLQLIYNGGFVNRGKQSNACSSRVATLYLIGHWVIWFIPCQCPESQLTDALCLILLASPAHLGPFAQLDLIPEEMKIALIPWLPGGSYA